MLTLRSGLALQRQPQRVAGIVARCQGCPVRTRPPQSLDSAKRPVNAARSAAAELASDLAHCPRHVLP